MEQPLQLAQRQAGALRERGGIQRLFEILLHQRKRLRQAGMGDALAGRRLHALAIVGRTDARMDELLRRGRREAVAMLQRDQMQQHVERGGAAGTSEAVAVDHEQAAVGLDLGEGFAERIQSFPMRGGAIAIEQSRPRQEEAAGVDGAEIDRAAVESGQPFARGAVEVSFRLEARAHDGKGEVELAVEAMIGEQRHAVGGGDRLAVARDHDPTIELAPGEAVRDAQRLHRRDESQHGKLRDDQEGDRLRRLDRRGLDPRLRRHSCPRALPRRKSRFVMA